jgi:phosphoribosylamine--glycine ligase
MDKGAALIVGSGGREHALVASASQSENIHEIYASPGNPGTAGELKAKNLNFDGADPANFEKLAAFADEKNVGLFFIGSETPLSLGLADKLRKDGRIVVGASQKASILESSKLFSHELMEVAGIAQPYGIRCHSVQEAYRAIDEVVNKDGVVLKCDGLALGKGVSIYATAEEAHKDLSRFATAFGEKILVSACEPGDEFSVFTLIGRNGGVATIPIAIQDHKRALVGDFGSNTGGMGAYGPADIFTPADIRNIHNNIVLRAIDAMKERGTPLEDMVLFTGGVKTRSGELLVYEFNVRFGDPEYQVVSMLLKDNIDTVAREVHEGGQPQINLHKGYGYVVVLTAPGYPEKAQKGGVIRGLDEASDAHNVYLFHAGTKYENRQLKVAGGRVLGVGAFHHDSLLEAKLNAAYAATPILALSDGLHARFDIANRAIRH